ADPSRVRTVQPYAFASSSSPRTRTSSKPRSEEHTSELQSLTNLVCRLLLEKKKNMLRFDHTGLAIVATECRLVEPLAPALRSRCTHVDIPPHSHLVCAGCHRARNDSSQP